SVARRYFVRGVDVFRQLPAASCLPIAPATFAWVVCPGRSRIRMVTAGGNKRSFCSRVGKLKLSENRLGRLAGSFRAVFGRSPAVVQSVFQHQAVAASGGG